MTRDCQNPLQKYLQTTEMIQKPPVANLRGRADPLLRSRGSWRARGAWGGTQITNFWCKPCSNKPMFSGVLSHVKCPSSSYRALASASRGSRGRALSWAGVGGGAEPQRWRRAGAVRGRGDAGVPQKPLGPSRRWRPRRRLARRIRHHFRQEWMRFGIYTPQRST